METKEIKMAEVEKELTRVILPEKIVEDASHKAKLLKQIVEQAGLAKRIGNNPRPYLQVEGWQTIGQFYGLTAACLDDSGRELVEPVEINGCKGFKARAVVRRIDNNEIVGGAEAYCLTDEPRWAKANTYALASMAQTRAISKAFRLMLSWVVVLAGYDPTPADEVPENGFEKHAQHETKPAQPVETKPAPQRHKPYWQNKFDGKDYLFASIGEHYNVNFLQNIGMKKSKKKQNLYYCPYSADVENALNDEYQAVEEINRQAELEKEINEGKGA